MSKIIQVGFNAFLLFFFCVGMLFAVDARSQFSLEKKHLLNSRKQNASSPGLSLLTENIGGPSSVGAQILGDVRIMKKEQFRFPALDEWIASAFLWKQSLTKRYNLDLGIDDVFLYQNSNWPSTDPHNASGHIFRIFGKWGLVNQNTANRGSLIFKVETRNRLFTSISPKELSDQIGYEGNTATSFLDTGPILNSLYWEQFLRKGDLGLVVGRLIPSDFVDVAGYSNSFTTFQNLLILSDPSIPIPDTGIGILTEINLRNHWFILAGLDDANGDKNNIGFFEKGFKTFDHLELGWSMSKENHYLRGVHLIAWTVSAYKKHEEPPSYGVGLSANWVFSHSLMPFFRVGCSSGPAPLMRQSLTSGLLYLLPNQYDVVGIGFNVGKTNSSTNTLQYTSELFYRFQLSKIIAITPSLQYLFHPALNPDRNSILVLGIRIRFVF